MKPTLPAALIIPTLLVTAAAVMLPPARGQDAAQPAAAPSTQPAGEPLAFVVKDIDGNDFDLARLKGKVVMIVNVASKCGLTPQYEGLQKLYEANRDRGLVVVGFPANNFKGQEPGTNEQIKEFCSTKYNVTFPMMSKVSVKGDDQHPLYKVLTSAQPATGDPAGEIPWNFTKFVIGRDGQVFARFNSKTKPDDAKVTQAVEQALAAPAPAAAAAAR